MKEPMMKKQPIKAVFFDLDGTLLDTANDLAEACSFVLRQYHRPPVDSQEFRNWIHGGAAMMICKSFQISVDNPDFPVIKSLFLQKYQEQLTKQTTLYAGIEQVLTFLEQQGISWGIVTNKNTQLTEPLMMHFGLNSRCCCIICGDTLPKAKPEPDPLLHACNLTRVDPKEAVYIGDTLGDIEAAKAAGLRSIAVSYGYTPQESNPSHWQANALVHDPCDIISTLALWNAS